MCKILFTHRRNNGQITVNKEVTGTVKTGVYGALYNWYVVTDSRGIAPSGWHVPTYSDYESLRTYLGGATVAGGKIKETGTDWWTTPNTGADNSSGFSLRGSGYRNGTTGAFASQKVQGWLISDTLFNNQYYTYFGDYNNDDMGRTIQPKTAGSSIRLIKDDSTDSGSMTDYDGNVYETIKIGSQVWMKSNLIVTHYNDGSVIPNITDNTAWAGLTTGAMCYYNNDATYGYSESTGTIDDGTEFSVTITGQRAVNPKIEEKTFSQDSPAVFTNLPYDTYVLTEELPSNIYSLTSIVPNSFQIWGGNKNVDVVITNFSTIFTPQNYGLLYNWYAVAGLAPSGWHVPTQAECQTLSDYLGGDTVSGGHLKVTGTTYWNTPNTGADDSVGFSLRGAGMRDYDGTFTALKTSGVFRTSRSYTYNSVLMTVVRYAQSSTDDLVESSQPAKGYGYPIRMLKDNSTSVDSVTDFDGNVYETVNINGQIWTKNNWMCKHLADGTSIPEETNGTTWAGLTTKAWCYYNNDSANL